MKPEWINALAGGVLIGVAASLMLLFNGRVMGISGILCRSFFKSEAPNGWRFSALAGLLCGGILLQIFYPQAFPYSPISSFPLIGIAGLLVGFGSVYGNGCTSGHGVCGISRLSIRSLLATCTFMATGALAIILLRALGFRS
jgi:hypothetical protein